MMQLIRVRTARRAISATGTVVVAVALLATTLGMSAPRRIASTDSVPLKDSANVVLSQYLGFSGKLRALQVTRKRSAKTRNWLPSWTSTASRGWAFTGLAWSRPREIP
jgi:hypothetical protein